MRRVARLPEHESGAVGEDFAQRRLPVEHDQEQRREARRHPGHGQVRVPYQGVGELDPVEQAGQEHGHGRGQQRAAPGQEG